MTNLFTSIQDVFGFQLFCPKFFQMEGKGEELLSGLGRGCSQDFFGGGNTFSKNFLKKIAKNALF